MLIRPAATRLPWELDGAPRADLPTGVACAALREEAQQGGGEVDTAPPSRTDRAFVDGCSSLVTPRSRVTLGSMRGDGSMFGIA